jgi:hypothetical protein
VPCGFTFPNWERYRVSTFHLCDRTGRLGLLSPPTGQYPCRETREFPSLPAYHFGQGRQNFEGSISLFSLVRLTMVTSIHICWPYYPNPSPVLGWDYRGRASLAFCSPLRRIGVLDIVGRASHHFGYTKVACLPRVPVTEYQVLSESIISSQNNHTSDFASRPALSRRLQAVLETIAWTYHDFILEFKSSTLFISPRLCFLLFHALYSSPVFIFPNHFLVRHFTIFYFCELLYFCFFHGPLLSCGF